MRHMRGSIDAPGMSQARFAQLWSAIDELPIAFPLVCVFLQALPDFPLKAQITRVALAF